MCLGSLLFLRNWPLSSEFSNCFSIDYPIWSSKKPTWYNINRLEAVILCKWEKIGKLMGLSDFCLEISSLWMLSQHPLPDLMTSVRWFWVLSAGLLMQWSWESILRLNISKRRAISFTRALFLTVDTATSDRAMEGLYFKLTREKGRSPSILHLFFLHTLQKKQSTVDAEVYFISGLTILFHFMALTDPYSTLRILNQPI